MMIGLTSKYRASVVINTKDDKAFRGIYWGTRGRFIRLRDAQMLENGQVHPVDGEVLVDRSNVSFYQRLLDG